MPTSTPKRRNRVTFQDYPPQPAPTNFAKPVNAQPQRFKPDPSQRFAIRFQQLIYVVTIDPASGRYRFEDFAQKIDAKQTPRPALPTWLLEPKTLNESVYQFRQGKLIPGFLHSIGTEEWVFVPDVDGAIINAKEYLSTYQPWSRRIYNLPGQFIPEK